MHESNAPVLQAIELLLRSMFRSKRVGSVDGGYQVSKPHIGTEIYFEAGALLEAALFIRREASPHLRSLSVQDLQRMLVNFMREEIESLRFNSWGLPDNASFADHINASEKIQLAEAMKRSPIFVTVNDLFLYPIKIAKVEASFRSQSFFLLPPEELAKELMQWYDPDEIRPNCHPPTPMHAGMPSADISCWLRVRAPLAEVALRNRNAILGACALLPHPLQRYCFSIATMPKGYMSFKSRATFHSGDASTPALSEYLEIATVDHLWLSALAEKLNSDSKRDRKSVLALQYFFRAWVKDPAARVAPLCGALDALFGDKEAATQAMVDAVGTQLGPEFDEARARKLAKLRAGVIHGGAPNIYEASIYHKYYTDYRCDPIRDLELATARCLQHEIFGGTLIERGHPYADFLGQYAGVGAIL
ncbi:hypothetical protein [Sphingobium sp.]|uniref:hypothetical protein n=1 Tax=Sphingobium sp. TaxID=1912891 RepID=UPI002E204953